MAAALTVMFEFEDARDYDFQHTNWEGPLPQVANTLEMVGRTGVWVINDVRWMVDVRRAESLMGRAVKVHLVRDKG